MASTAAAALQLSSTALDELFNSSPAGSIPNGRGAGTALIAPGFRVSSSLAWIGAVLWRGKDFDPGRHELVNLFTPLHLRGFRAEVREETSILDGRPCVVLDYSKTSVLAMWVRDEIRQVAPKDYLGLVFVRGHRLPLRFWLSFADTP